MLHPHPKIWGNEREVFNSYRYQKHKHRSTIQFTQHQSQNLQHVEPKSLDSLSFFIDSPRSPCGKAWKKTTKTPLKFNGWCTWKSSKWERKFPMSGFFLQEGLPGVKIAKSRSSECVWFADLECSISFWITPGHEFFKSTWTVYYIQLLWCNLLVLFCLTSTQIAWLIPSNLGWMLPCCIIVVEADSSISMSALAKFPLKRRVLAQNKGNLERPPAIAAEQPRAVPMPFSPFWRRIRSA